MAAMEVYKAVIDCGRGCRIAARYLELFFQAALSISDSVHRDRNQENVMLGEGH